MLLPVTACALLVHSVIASNPYSPVNASCYNQCDDVGQPKVGCCHIGCQMAELAYNVQYSLSFEYSQNTTFTLCSYYCYGTYIDVCLESCVAACGKGSPPQLTGNSTYSIGEAQAALSYIIGEPREQEYGYGYGYDDIALATGQVSSAGPTTPCDLTCQEEVQERNAAYSDYDARASNEMDYVGEVGNKMEYFG